MGNLIQFGIETELGITRDTDEEIDVVAESIALVRSARAPGVRMRWDYACEDPHADARGFRVRELRQDTDEANYFEQDSNRALTFSEIKSDLVLANGARFYNDHAHPEYCTPECSTLAELVAQDRAGELIAMACAKHLSEGPGGTVRLYKNNTDFQGHSYGCHENYLLPRTLAWKRLAEGMQAFLVTRQVYAGAGKFGFEAEDRFLKPGFQISQRSDFFSVLQSVDTMQRRPLINTRDEPHADPQRFRRFHVILGDANMSPFATWLKVGATALVLEALVREPRAELPQLVAPVSVLKAISHDPEFRWELRLTSGPSTALEVQRAYLAFARAHGDLDSAERQELVRAWETVLDDLEADHTRCRDRLDWVAKRLLIEEFREAEGVAPDDPWLHSLDLEYHRLDPDEGLFFGLERAGLIAAVAGQEDAAASVTEPPRGTRAYVRGRCVQKFPKAILSAQWDHVTLEGSRGPIRLPLDTLFDPEELERWRRVIDAAAVPDDLQPLATVPV